MARTCDLAIVMTADPFYLIQTGESWRNEKACFHLAGRFVDSSPQG
jgi:hypothetical protein